MNRTEKHVRHALKVQWREWMRLHPHLCYDCTLDRATCGAKVTELDPKDKDIANFVMVIPEKHFHRVLKCPKYTRVGLVSPAPLVKQK